MLKHWETSMLGIVLILAGVYTGVTAKTSWTESSIIITIGVGFLRSSDANKV